MNVCTTGNFRVQYSSCTPTAVATGNVMFLFMALNQVVIFFGLATNTLKVRNNNNNSNNNKLMYHKKCYVSFHGAQGVLLYHRK